MAAYKPFKFATEAGVLFHLKDYWTCQQSDFEQMTGDPMLPYYNIYFICQRNRIEVQPNSMQVTSDTISFAFDVHEKNKTFSTYGAIQNLFGSENIRLESEYPHNYFNLIADSGDMARVKASEVVFINRENIFPRPAFLDLEVLYIGQTNRDSDSAIVDRLINHKTLQKIYSDKKPDKEVYLVLCSFVQDGFIESRGTVKVQPEFEQDDIERLQAFLKNRLEITHEQQINLTEAALIRFFDPPYNKIYKTSFPTEAHSKYDECYKLGLNAVTIEINTDQWFFSQGIATSSSHTKTFFLSNDEERRKLFDFTVEFDKDSDIP